MLKVLKIRATGYKLLKDNFEINLVTKARVMSTDYTKEIFSITDGLNSFKSLAVVGGNASGKSTVLSLLLDVYSFLGSGRWPNINFINSDSMHIEIDFYLDNKIYFYSAIFKKNLADALVSNVSFSTIHNEKIEAIVYDPLKGKKNFLLRDKYSIDLTDKLLSKSLFDTSAIGELTKNNVYYDSFNRNNLIGFYEGALKKSFFYTLQSCERVLANEIIHLLDDSIEYIECINDRMLRFKRFNHDEEILPNEALISILSSGTLRGIELYIKAVDALRNGKVLIVDEIENCFHKNLVFNLIYLFNSELTNKNNAQLIFSTHYTEILDILDRQDSIYITHKEKGMINIKNLKDYGIRTELTKSKQFDNNVFDTSPKYEEFIKIKEILAK